MNYLLDVTGGMIIREGTFIWQKIVLRHAQSELLPGMHKIWEKVNMNFGHEPFTSLKDIFFTRIVPFTQSL